MKLYSLKILFSVFILSLNGCALQKVRKQYDYSFERDVTYKSINGIQLMGDLYLPNDLPGLKPAVLTVHGGGWSSRSGDMRGIAQHLAHQGFVVFNITYRLAPKYKYPAAVEDVTDALKWLQTNAAKYNIDTNRIAGWGYSAGAHLISLVGVNPANKMKAVVAGGTPADFSLFDPKSPRTVAFMGGNYFQMKARWDEASPQKHVQKNSPPFFLYHSRKDTLVYYDQLISFEKALKAKGVYVQAHTVEFWGHIGTYAFSQESVDLGTKFLFKQFGL